jgi:hypothetical protein
MLVDTLGLVHALAVQPASVQDRDGAKEVFAKAKGKLPHLVKVWLLAKEYEQTVESSETDLYCTLTHRMLRFTAN